MCSKSVATLRGMPGKYLTPRRNRDAENRTAVLMNSRARHHKFHKRKYLPSKRIARRWLFASECYFPKSVNRNAMGDLAAAKIFFSARTIARIKIDELYARSSPALLRARRDAVCNENPLCADP